MNIKNLYAELDNIIPRSLSCAWDNDGLMCCPDPGREVNNILLSLDVTESAVETAVSSGADLIISHHPMIFRPIRGITDRMYIRLILSGISVFSFHTRFDALEGGINDALAEALGLDVISRGIDEGIGIICSTPEETDIKTFTNHVKTSLSAKAVKYACGNTNVKKIALIGGDCGNDFLYAAESAGCDTVVTGAVGYNNMIDAARRGINVIAAGHFQTENPGMFKMLKIVKDIIPTLSAEVFCETPELTLI